MSRSEQLPEEPVKIEQEAAQRDAVKLAQQMFEDIRKSRRADKEETIRASEKIEADLKKLRQLQRQRYEELTPAVQAVLESYNQALELEADFRAEFDDSPNRGKTGLNNRIAQWGLFKDRDQHGFDRPMKEEVLVLLVTNMEGDPSNFSTRAYPGGRGTFFADTADLSVESLIEALKQQSQHF